MENKENSSNYFNYSPTLPEYPKLYKEIEEIWDRHKKVLNIEILDENEFISRLTSIIRYAPDDQIFSALRLFMIECLKDKSIQFYSDYNSILEELSQDIILVKHKYSSFIFVHEEIEKTEKLKKLASKFLFECKIWKQEFSEDLSESELNKCYDEQEWDIEYINILKLSLYATNLLELDEIYKYSWLDVCIIFKNEIHQDSKKIWDKLPLWKKYFNESLLD